MKIQSIIEQTKEQNALLNDCAKYLEYHSFISGFPEKTKNYWILKLKGKSLQELQELRKEQINSTAKNFYCKLNNSKL